MAREPQLYSISRADTMMPSWIAEQLDEPRARQAEVYVVATTAKAAGERLRAAGLTSSARGCQPATGNHARALLAAFPDALAAPGVVFVSVQTSHDNAAFRLHPVHVDSGAVVGRWLWDNRQIQFRRDADGALFPTRP